MKEAFVSIKVSSARVGENKDNTFDNFKEKLCQRFIQDKDTPRNVVLFPNRLEIEKIDFQDDFRINLFFLGLEERIFEFQAPTDSTTFSEPPIEIVVPKKFDIKIDERHVEKLKDITVKLKEVIFLKKRIDLRKEAMLKSKSRKLNIFVNPAKNAPVISLEKLEKLENEKCKLLSEVGKIQKEFNFKLKEELFDL